jgi:hypothetical protein
MKQYYLLILILITLCLGACKVGRSANSKGINGTLHNMTGMDGCSWIIQLDTKLDDGTEKLEPVNLNAFALKLSEGQQVTFTFHDFAGSSICMTGKIVELEQISAR